MRTPGAALEQLPCALGRERLLRLDPHRLRVADQHRHAHARRADRQLGQLHDLPRLLADLRLLVELLAVEVPVHGEILLARLPSHGAVHPLRPAPETDW